MLRFGLDKTMELQVQQSEVNVEIVLKTLKKLIKDNPQEDINDLFNFAFKVNHINIEDLTELDLKRLIKETERLARI